MITLYLVLNAVFASALAAVVYACSHFIRNARIVHLLWVVVLLRFLAPPLVDIPFSGSFLEAESRVTTTPGGLHRDATGELQDIAHQPTATIAPESRIPFSRLLTWIWAAGSILVLALAMVRGLRLRFLTQRTGTYTEALQLQVRRLSTEMGLRQAPKALLVPARISPMVWAWFGRPVVLLPKELWETLSDEEKGAILRHELAHLARRDHWVRVVEALATVTHWWCPVLWWARRELHRYEERCCDGLALSSGLESRAALARACMQTIDFIGQRRSSRFQFGVSGMAGFDSLRQRINFILEGDHMHALSQRVAVTLCLVVLLALGVSPGFGEPTLQDETYKTVTVPDAFESLRVIGGIDVAIQFGPKQEIAIGDISGSEPSFIVDDENRLVITLNGLIRQSAKRKRPKVVITTPKMIAIEAKTNAAVSVAKVKAPVLVVAVEEHSQVVADGHCKSLTVTADNSSTFLGSKMTAAAAVVAAQRKSAISIGSVQSLVRNSDSTSNIEVVGSNVVSLRLDKQ